VAFSAVASLSVVVQAQKAHVALMPTGPMPAVNVP
jgi:hypothetical protein